MRLQRLRNENYVATRHLKITANTFLFALRKRFVFFSKSGGINHSLKKIRIMFKIIANIKIFGELFCLFSFIVLTKQHSSHNFHGTAHSSHDDHIAFLGKEMAKEFDKLTPQESRRRLR